MNRAPTNVAVTDADSPDAQAGELATVIAVCRAYVDRWGEGPKLLDVIAEQVCGVEIVYPGGDPGD